ncbi:hypothetical protein XU18_0412 [Perkinsela sp. CCAP 1560/4]|nr:hypothetical protein XU18_0412 [Perkinsela sp. CCAP 1560/4]|eukprot:KNH09727.1 hypothetical protein XU18_0412 [Perkinsela sp. CCAP 1560/4]
MLRYLLQNAFDIPRFLPITAILVFLCWVSACFKPEAKEFYFFVLSAYAFYLFRVVESMIGSKNYALILSVSVVASKGADLCVRALSSEHRNESFTFVRQYSEVDRIAAIIALILFAYRHIPRGAFPPFYASICFVLWSLGHLCARARLKILLISAINLGANVRLFPHKSAI